MSKIIRDWGKFDDNGIFQYALNPLGFVCNPTDEQLTDARYRRVAKDNKPEDPEGERGFWKESEPMLDGDVIRISWNWVKDEDLEPMRGSRKFSKLRHGSDSNGTVGPTCHLDGRNGYRWDLSEDRV